MLPSVHGFHRVDVCVEEDGRLLLAETSRKCPNIVAVSLRLESVDLQMVLHDVSGFLLIPADGGSGDELLKELNGVFYHGDTCFGDKGSAFLIEKGKQRRKNDTIEARKPIIYSIVLKWRAFVVFQARARLNYDEGSPFR